MNDNQKQSPASTESPASWNTRYVSPNGFTCQLTLRSENGKDLLEKAEGAMAFLSEHGCTPFNGYSNGYKPSGNQSKKGNPSSSNPDASWCPIHQCDMKRWEKDGRAWYSHKVNGDWCTGKAKNGK